MNDTISFWTSVQHDEQKPQCKKTQNAAFENRITKRTNVFNNKSKNL